MGRARAIDGAVDRRLPGAHQMLLPCEVIALTMELKGHSCGCWQIVCVHSSHRREVWQRGCTMHARAASAQRVRALGRNLDRS